MNYLLRGIREGFRIGFKGSSSVSLARKKCTQQWRIQRWFLLILAEEKKRGVLLGPFAHGEVPGVHLNRFGVIPKSSQNNC